MEEILKQLSLYDLFGYFVPGAVVLWAAIGAVNACSRADKPLLPAVGMPFYLIAAYIVGHMVQATASYVVQDLYKTRSTTSVEAFYKERFEKHGDDSKDGGKLGERIRAAIEEAFGKDISRKDDFRLAQSYAQVKKIDSYIEIMQARSAFFRGLALALAIAALLFLARIACHRSVARWQNISLAVLFLVGAGLSFSRFTKFDDAYVDHTFRAFYVDFKVSEKEPKPPAPKTGARPRTSK